MNDKEKEEIFSSLKRIEKRLSSIERDIFYGPVTVVIVITMYVIALAVYLTK